MRAVRADPAAVGDHVQARKLGQGRTGRSPKQLEPGALLRGDHADQHVEAALQLLRVLEDLVGRQPTAGGDGQAEQPTPGIELPAARGGQAVDQVTAGRVALGKQHRPRPDQGQRQGRGGDPGCSLVGRDRDQAHR